ncbi:MAG: YbaB/EbfC family nucleoid-associated protein [bacterium]
MVNPISQINKVNKLRKIGEQKKKEMEAIKIQGVSDKQRVKVTLNGTYEIIHMEIEDELLSSDKKEMLIKAICSAHTDARKKLEKELAKTMDISQLMEMFS